MKRYVIVAILLAMTALVGSFHSEVQAGIAGLCSLQNGKKCKNGTCLSVTAKCLTQVIRTPFKKKIIAVFCLCEEPVEVPGYPVAE